MPDRKDITNKISDVLFGIVSAKKGAGLGGALFPGAQQRAAIRSMSPSDLIMNKLYIKLAGEANNDVPPDDITEAILNKNNLDTGKFSLTSSTIKGNKFENFGSQIRGKVAEKEALLPAEVKKAEALASVDIDKSSKQKWSDEDAIRTIKYDVLTPKLNSLMEAGGRAMVEMKDTAAKMGISIDFSKGGLEGMKTAAVKSVFLKTKMAPLMKAVKNMGPELGIEMMRQIGPIRSGEVAKDFEKTLAQFNGDIREDIANMTTSMKKNKANIVLLDKNGKPLSDEKKYARMDTTEANLIRRYNSMYRGMGLMKESYTAERSFDWLAENSTFNEKENEIIDAAVADLPGYDRMKITSKLIEKGIL